MLLLQLVNDEYCLEDLTNHNKLKHCELVVATSDISKVSDISAKVH